MEKVTVFFKVNFSNGRLGLVAQPVEMSEKTIVSIDFMKKTIEASHPGVESIETITFEEYKEFSNSGAKETISQFANNTLQATKGKVLETAENIFSKGLSKVKKMKGDE